MRFSNLSWFLPTYFVYRLCRSKRRSFNLKNIKPKDHNMYCSYLNLYKLLLWSRQSYTASRTQNLRLRVPLIHPVVLYTEKFGTMHRVQNRLCDFVGRVLLPITSVTLLYPEYNHSIHLRSLHLWKIF